MNKLKNFFFLSPEQAFLQGFTHHARLHLFLPAYISLYDRNDPIVVLKTWTLLPVYWLVEGLWWAAVGFLTKGHRFMAIGPRIYPYLWYMQDSKEDAQ